MPESSSPFDDPFADLFGKLPDPRQRESGRGDSAEVAKSTTAAQRSGDAAPAPASPPLSRRAAREAAQEPPAPAAPVARSVPAASPAAEDPGPAAAGAPVAPRMPSRTAVATAPVPTADLEDLFTGTRTTHDVGSPPPPRNKRKRRIGGWIALGVVLVILGGIAGGGLWVWNTYEGKIREVMGWTEPKDYAAGEANGEALVTIAEGDTGSPISQSLFDAGVTKTPTAFYDYLIATAQNPPFVPGVFKLQKQMTSEAALAALLDPANKVERSAQLREGLTVQQSLPILAEGTGIPLADFQAAVATPASYGVSADSLEGWLFPATYSFAPDATATQIIQTLVDRTVQSLDAASVPVEDRQRILTIASIIQREARFTQDFYKVSRVIENRLDPSNQETFGLLQMDSTAQYGYGEMHDGTVSSSEAALTDDNAWNTYVHPGLPVGPIANPGDTAIDAAMHPADGPWLYFVTVNLDTGETVFTTNVADHEKAVAQWQTWCTDHPDSGC
ncbi:endolytic transglycosylase MltG [Microbacterium rhizomatis]|uniref:Endolytic murein transglycosylase n=1 Tax=Microbacterium rhizomatis TaxID=1631477 RepID=A0A5J5J3K1_9MICO|nr:endolytic transglycosylase MltG [Microbacterium rhizomatis]KAA9110552.1 endolytic transglycosylase MltG [Microbacterium rhizomatis]